MTVRARGGRERGGRGPDPRAARPLGVRSKALGKHLRLHPVMVVWGQMDEEVRPWEGMLSATFSDQHADMDGNGYGIKYEHVATPPSILLSFSPWRGGRAHQELMQALPHTAGIGILLRDHGRGEVRVGRDGEPIVRYAFTRRRHRPPAARAVGRSRAGRGDGRAADLLVARRSGSPTSPACAATGPRS